MNNVERLATKTTARFVFSNDQIFFIDSAVMKNLEWTYYISLVHNALKMIFKLDFYQIIYYVYSNALANATRRLIG